MLAALLLRRIQETERVRRFDWSAFLGDRQPS
jgi:hypothetical protein